MVTLFLCGDVMTGRGVDQILAHPSDRRIFEPYVRDAREYVASAEARNGSIPAPVPDAYVWGDALPQLERSRPDVRIANLETSVTASDDVWRGKGINYRMHPDNVGCLTAAGLDVCVLANNHVLDWGYAGLEETLDALARAGLKTCGAGRNAAEAMAPAAVPLGGGARALVFGLGANSSGIPLEWRAAEGRPGVNLLPDLSDATAATIGSHIRSAKAPGDLAVVSVHWGSNWGYSVPAADARFARRLVEEGADVVHGHSSHHPRPVEVYRGRLILYGCGDFINDYEGISGYDAYRGDLALMYFAALSAPDFALSGLRMAPLQIRNMRLNRAPADDARWLGETLDRISDPFGCGVELTAGGDLGLRWS